MKDIRPERHLEPRDLCEHCPRGQERVRFRPQPGGTTMTDRREFLQGAIASVGASAAGLSMTGLPIPKWMAAEDFGGIRAEIEKRHDESVKRLQNWIKLPSIAAENCNMNEGC